MNILRHILVAVIATASWATVTAQTETTGALEWSKRHNLEYEVNAGLNIGGTSPLPLPDEIREINSYNPNLNLYVGTNVTKWFGRDNRWGMMLGLRLETKGMETRATVKNYGMEIIQDGSRVAGNWTGHVKTRYRGTCLTVPLMAAYKVNDRLKVSLGPYISWSINGDFDGHVYDGYLREGDPTGPKVTFEGDHIATYDFSGEMRKALWGFQGGVTWKAFKHLTVQGNLTWGMNDIFRHSFRTITFSMYPIYLNVGFGYAFN